ncbi:MAG: hypothetical protein LBH72_03860 [Proteiniphilum sp.]|nr:hypothetical protein [Proteiniphilum sp.]
MNIQLITVIVIGTVTGAVLLRKLYGFFFTGKNSSRCSGCQSCDLGKVRTPKGHFPKNRHG